MAKKRISFLKFSAYLISPAKDTIITMQLNLKMSSKKLTLVMFPFVVFCNFD